MTNKQIIRALEKRRKEMAVLRDHLRDLESAVVDEFERVKDAYDSLEYCIQRLSESV